jgi:palmitoyltransferase
MWLVKDTAGIVCVVLTYLVMLTVSVLTCYAAVVPLADEFLSAPLAILGYFILLGLAASSHLKCVLTDPGTTPLNSASGDEKDLCLRCYAVKGSRVHHCSTCGRCVMRMDHHCPWVNNCVGYYNQKLFILFLFYTELACLYTFALLALRATYCPFNPASEVCFIHRRELSLQMCLGICAFFLNLVFALFLGAMLQDQLYCVINNTSGIDLLQKKPIEKRPLKTNFEEVFGGRLSLKWFVPTSVPPISAGKVTLEESV